jgi:hypothetical protein
MPARAKVSITSWPVSFQRVSSGSDRGPVAGSRSSSWTRRRRPAGRAQRSDATPRSDPPVHDDKPADSGVEAPLELGCAGVALDEAHVTQPERLRAPAGNLERGTVDVDADHLTLGTDELGRQQGNVSGTAAHLEDAHARLEAGRPEELLGRASEEGRLAAQALIFRPRARQRVCGVGLRTRGAAAGLGGMTHDLRVHHPSGTRIGEPPDPPIHPPTRDRLRPGAAPTNAAAIADLGSCP